MVPDVSGWGVESEIPRSGRYDRARWLEIGKDKGEPSPIQAFYKARNRNNCRQVRLGRSARHSPQYLEAGRVERTAAKMKYLVVIEEGESSFGAYVPDLPGCAVVGESREFPSRRQLRSTCRSEKTASLRRCRWFGRRERTMGDGRSISAPGSWRRKSPSSSGPRRLPHARIMTAFWDRTSARRANCR